jgi:ADP-ribosylglycohydrolase
MLGAIIGDIVGSIYEFNNIRTKDFPLFTERCFFTDDTVMTVAVAKAIMAGGKKDDFIDAMKSYGRRFPKAGYGRGFDRWLKSESRESYNSYGNGAAMRVSPAAFLVRLHDSPYGLDWLTTRRKVLTVAKRSAEVTHDHPEGISGAQAVAEAIVYMRVGREIAKDVPSRRSELKGLLEEGYGYNMSRSLDEIRLTNQFDTSCQGTVPVAITAFAESVDFEDAIRNAVSVGGDSDTIAAITGSIAQAAYGVPGPIREKALLYLPKSLLSAVLEVESKMREDFPQA